MTREIIKFYLYFIVLYFASCTPKMVEIKPSEDPIVTTEKKEPKGPCVAFDDLLPHEKETAENAFVLYKDFMKVKNYKEAMHYWKIAYAMAPGSNGRAKNHFEDGASLYKQLHDGTTDMVLKRKYIDTIMSIYDMKKKCFGDEAYINGLKAFDYYYNYPGYVDDETIYNLFKSNFDIKGKNADYFVVNPFTKMLYDRIVDGKVSHEEGRKYADLIFQTVEHGMATCKGKICEAWQVIDEYAPSRLEGLEGIDGFYNCGYYTKKYYPMYKANMDSCDIINLVYARLLRGDCLPTDANIMELKAVKATKCYVAPPALSCAAQAYEDYSQGKYSSAIQSYESCIDKASDDDTKAKYLLLIAKIYYRDLKNFPKSRKYALDAAKVRPGWGEPYLLIGNLYASSGPLCGTGRGWESQVVTWPAIDMWNKAKSVDPTVAREASALISRYWQYMPKKEDIFFRSLNAGSSYFVPCWIQESTVIRTAD